VIIGLVILSLSVAIQTTSFQNYITKRLIEDINEYELNNSEYKLDIYDSSISLNGKLVLNSVVLVNSKSDTLVSLDKVESSFFPLFQRKKQFKDLIIEGLNIDASISNDNENISKMDSSFKLEQLSNSIGLESLIISDSNLDFIINNQPYIVDELNLKFKDISIDNNIISLHVDDLSGQINKSIDIQDFESDIIIDNQSIDILGYELIIQDNTLSGDLKLDLDDNSNINKIEGILNESIVDLTKLNDFQEIPESLKNIKTTLDFSGNNENIEINSFSINSQDFKVNGNGIVEGYNDQNTINLNLEIDQFSPSLNNIIKFDSSFQSIEIIDKLLFKGIIGFNNNKLVFDLNHNNSLSQNIKFFGDVDFREKINFEVEMITDLDNDSIIISDIGFNKIKSKINIKGSLDDKPSVERFDGNILIDSKSSIDFIGNIKNNYISSAFNMINNESEIELKLNGNIKDGVYNIYSEVNNISSNDIINSKNPSKISFNSQVSLKLIESLNFESDIFFTDIQIVNSNDKIILGSLSDLNDQFQQDLINDNRQYDFKIKRIDDVYEVTSLLGDKIKLSGNFYNLDKLFLNLKILDLNLNNFFPKDKREIIYGKSLIDISLERDEINRNFSFEAITKDIKVRDTELGEMKISLSGNTDYNSYAVNINLSSNNEINLDGSGSIIAINEKPNIDLDLNLNDFNFSFVDQIGRNVLSEIDGFASGNINIWGELDNIQHNGNLILNNSKFYIPYLNVDYAILNNSELNLYNQIFEFKDVNLIDPLYNTNANIRGTISHSDFKDWELDLGFNSDKLFVLNKEFNPEEYYHGVAFIDGEIDLNGPSKELVIQVEARTQEGTKINIPRSRNFNIESFSFIEFIDKKTIKDITDFPIDESIMDNRGLELSIDLEIDNNADIEITIDTENGSYLSGQGLGNLLMEIDTDGKFNIYGDFSTTSGIYNFKNLGLIDKKFNVKSGGSIVWDGDPLQAQMDIEALYEVPGGSNPALLLDNPNFNKKIPTDVQINLKGDLAKPDNPDFEIFFPNTSSTVTSEINYKLIDPEVRQLQAISLLSQGVFINEVSVSIEGLTNNIYEKVSDVFSEILGGDQGPLKVGLNYLQGDKSEILDIKTEDRFGVTLSTKISDKILFNGKIGVPIGGIEETLIIGDVEIEFLLNDDGTLKAKVFNRENEFRYIGDELGYTQGMGLSYQVDFESFREILSKLVSQD